MAINTFYRETEFKQTAIGELPKEWEVVRLNDIAEKFLGGGTPSTSNPEYWDGDIPWMTSANLTGKSVLQGMRNITKRGLESSATNLVPKGSLLVSTRVGIGKVGIAGIDIAISQDLTGIVVDSQKIDAEYLYWSLLKLQRHLRRLSQGSTIKGLLREYLGDVQIPLPALAEQCKVTEILSAVDEAHTKTNEIISKTELLKKGLMRELLTNGIGHKEFRDTDIGKIPNEWKTKSLKELCSDIVDCPHSTPKFTPSGVLIVRNFNIRDGELQFDPAYYTSEQEWTKRTRRLVPKDGDVLFSREAPIGEASLAPPNTHFSLGQRTMLLRTDKRQLDPLFLVYSFYSPLIRQRLRNLEAGVTAHHVNVADVRALMMPVPSIEEQKKIVKILSIVGKKINVEKAERNNLQTVKQGLMNLLLTGKIRIKVG